jgi:hypothetical protein
MTQRMLILSAVFACSVAAANTRGQTEAEKAPIQAVQQFYELETEGRWLGPEHWTELQDFLTDVGPWDGALPVSVLKSYRVGNARRDVGHGGVVDYQVEVVCLELGSIDSFLHFSPARGSKAEGLPTGQPVKQQAYETLVFTDKYVKRNQSGDSEEKGALRWRMPMFAAPSVNIDAALRWVIEKRGKSSDPVIRYNADRTILILKNLAAGTPPTSEPTGTPRESSSKVVRRFIALESRSMPEEWDRVAEFFAVTPKPRWDHVYIVDVVGMGTDENGDSADAGVSTNSLGELDSSMRLSNYPLVRQPLDGSSISACFGDDRFGFSLLLSRKYWRATKNGAVRELDGPLAWRIEDTSFAPLVNLDTAIRYVRRASEEASDPKTKRNAARSLRILESYKEGKPLPDELAAHASGCD